MSTIWERWCSRESAQQLLWVALLVAALTAASVDCRSLPSLDEVAQVSSGLEAVPVQGRMRPLGTLALWELPTAQPKKVFLILHGRDVRPYDYWHSSISCPGCTGRPESSKIVRDAIDMDYAVFIPDSLVSNGDWDAWPENTVDLDNVVTMFFEWRRAHGLEDLPVVALGISAGGHALSTLSLRLGPLFESIIIMISKGVLPVWDKITGEFPPTLFMHMPKDAETATYITEIRKKLRAQGVHSEELRWYEKPISVEWFTQLIPELGLEVAQAIVRALIADGLIREENTCLTSLEFKYDWEDRVRRWGVLPDDPRANGKLMFQQSVLDELLVAYAYHGTLSRRDDALFGWFEGDYAGQNIATY